MRLEKIIDSIIEALQEDRNENPEDDSISCCVDLGNKYIDIFLSSKIKECVVVDYKNGDRDFDRVNEYIENQLPEYHEFEYEPELDMWQSHGFADERDYNNWRYGPIATRWR